MDDFEEDILEFPFSEFKNYADLIFERKIRKFVFSYNGKSKWLDGPEKLIYITPMRGSENYFCWFIGEGFEEEDIIKHYILHDQFYTPLEGQKNNFEDCLNYTCDEGSIVRLRCPKLTENSLKPAKRE